MAIALPASSNFHVLTTVTFTKMSATAGKTFRAYYSHPNPDVAPLGRQRGGRPVTNLACAPTIAKGESPFVLGLAHVGVCDWAGPPLEQIDANGGQVVIFELLPLENFLWAGFKAKAPSME